MHLLFSLFASLIIPSLTISIPQPPRLLTPAQNHTSIPTLNAWPPLPFLIHVHGHTRLKIITFSPWDPPVDKEHVKFYLADIAHFIHVSGRARSYLPSDITFSSGDEHLDVRLGFFAPGLRSITYAIARKIANDLYDLTSQYGARQITWAEVEVDGVVVSQMLLHFG